jgi:hypothetical protein
VRRSSQIYAEARIPSVVAVGLRPEIFKVTRKTTRKSYASTLDLLTDMYYN